MIPWPPVRALCDGLARRYRRRPDLRPRPRVPRTHRSQRLARPLYLPNRERTSTRPRAPGRRSPPRRLPTVFSSPRTPLASSGDAGGWFSTSPGRRGGWKIVPRILELPNRAVDRSVNVRRTRARLRRPAEVAVAQRWSSRFRGHLSQPVGDGGAGFAGRGESFRED